MARKEAPVVFEDWVELDLSAAERAGSLQPVFGMHTVLQPISDVLVSEGRRTPVLVGQPEVGKFASIHAIVSQAHAGRGPAIFHGVRFVQLSLSAIASDFKDTCDGTDTVQKILDHLLRCPQPTVPFVRDLHLA